MKTEPIEIWQEYQKGTEYLTRNNVYETVKCNENFYEGNQWIGLEDNDSMPKPVINILQRVVKYLIATLGSNDVSISMTPFSEGEQDQVITRAISQELEHVIEQARLMEDSKIVIRNAAVDGSAFMLQSFDSDFETHQEMKGRVINQVVDNTNVYFGNPYSRDLQSQPYIIIALRQHISQVKQEARELGVKEDDVNSIHADNDTNQVNDDSTDLVTVLLKFYKKKTKYIEKAIGVDELGNQIEIDIEKERKTVWFTKCTKDIALIEPKDLGYTRYPISMFGWDLQKNSYLYESPLTAVIPNQVFINKIIALCMLQSQQSVLPKTVFDKNKVNIDKILNSTSPQAVAGLDMAGKYLDFIKVPDFSTQVISLLELVMTQTKECMGANDSALGNVDPKNTSAIIALQQASAVPLEIQKQGFYQFWEDTVRNIIDIMSCTYGYREMLYEGEIIHIDFEGLKELNYELNVDVGEGAQYSEVAQINTLENLYSQGIVDPETLVDTLPNKYIPAKGKILSKLKERQQQAEQLAQQQSMQQNAQPMVQAQPNQTALNR